MSIAWTVKEQRAARTLTEDNAGGQASQVALVRTFHVEAREDDIPIEVDGWTVLRYCPELPQMGDEWLDPNDDDEPTGIVVRTRTARRASLERSNKDVFVEVRYWLPDAGGELASYSDVRVQFVQWWRSQASPQTYDGEDPDWPVGEPLDGPSIIIPPVGLVDNENTDDIAGKRIDVAGTPTSVLRVRGQFVRSLLVAASDFDDTANRVFLGKRNSQPFFGYPPGSVVYLGARTSQAFRGAPVQVDHTFAYDEYFHMEQQPKRSGGGIIALDENRHAAEVYWRQPFPDYDDLRLVVDDGTL